MITIYNIIIKRIDVIMELTKLKKKVHLKFLLALFSHLLIVSALTVSIILATIYIILSGAPKSFKVLPAISLMVSKCMSFNFIPKCPVVMSFPKYGV